MKTQPDYSCSETFEDLIFENRNKAYGAYDLNRKYRKYLLIAFSVTLLGISSVIAVPFIKSFLGTGNHSIFDYSVPINMSRIHTGEMALPPPVPPSPPANTEKTTVYKPPVIVEQANEEAGLMSTLEIIEITVNVPVDEPLEIVKEEKSAGIDEKPEEPVLFPEEHASFMGGDVNAFRLWIMNNITYPQTAIENRIFGRLLVEFCVNSKGAIVDIRFIRKLDPSIDNEVLRVIQSSPPWNPAKQGGMPVKQRFIIPVIFVMQ
jgi:protein TonB